MSGAQQTKVRVEELHEEDVIRVLHQQHTHIRELFSAVKAAQGEQRRRLFDDLRHLLAVHEAAEEVVLRPITRTVDAGLVADARNDEEKKAMEVLHRLEVLDVDEEPFPNEFESFEGLVVEHAEREESEEFPVIVSTCDEQTRTDLGQMVKQLEAVAPTHPHPGAAGSTFAQLVAGPLSSVMDRMRDKLSH